MQFSCCWKDNLREPLRVWRGGTDAKWAEIRPLYSNTKRTGTCKNSPSCLFFKKCILMTSINTHVSINPKHIPRCTHITVYIPFTDSSENTLDTIQTNVQESLKNLQASLRSPCKIGRRCNSKEATRKRMRIKWGRSSEAIRKGGVPNTIHLP